jgi:hypothetical protein
MLNFEICLLIAKAVMSLAAGAKDYTERSDIVPTEHARRTDKMEP